MTENIKMNKKIGYIKTRSRTLSLVEQGVSLVNYGVDDVLDDLDKALRPETIGDGDVLVVCGLAIIGRVNILKAFWSIAENGGLGIYSLKTKRLYSVDLEQAKDVYDAIEEIKGNETEILKHATKGKAGRKLALTNEAIEKGREMKSNGVCLDAIAAELGVCVATVGRHL